MVQSGANKEAGRQTRLQTELGQAGIEIEKNGFGYPYTDRQQEHTQEKGGY
jgi:hypothetical protein